MTEQPAIAEREDCPQRDYGAKCVNPACQNRSIIRGEFCWPCAEQQRREALAIRLRRQRAEQ